MNIENQNKRVIRLNEVMKMTGLGKSTIYKMKADNRFPLPFSLGERAVGWWEHEIVEWIENKASMRTDLAGVDYASD